MLEENACAMLAAVNEACRGGGFKIIEEDELARVVAKEDVPKTLAYLEQKRLIELRYADEGTYCVRTMPEGRSYLERCKRETAERRRGRRELFLYSFFGAAAGGFAAALVAGLVALFL